MCPKDGLSETNSPGSVLDGNLNDLLYTPACWKERQRQQADELFRTQGFATSVQLASLGVNAAAAQDYVRQSFVSTLVQDVLLFTLTIFFQTPFRSQVSLSFSHRPHQSSLPQLVLTKS